MELLFWLPPACAALWFLAGFGNGFLLNSAIGIHQIFPSDGILRFRASTQHFTGNTTIISSIPRLSIYITISNSVLPATTATTVWDPTRSTGINPSHSPISPANPSATAIAGLGPYRIPHTQTPTQPNTFYLSSLFFMIPGTLLRIPDRTGTISAILWATVQHIQSFCLLLVS